MRLTSYILSALALLGGLTAAQARPVLHPPMRYTSMRHHRFSYPGHHHPLVNHPGVYVHHGIYRTRLDHQ